jgi:hypothetical protein
MSEVNNDDVKLYHESGCEMLAHPSDVARLKKQGWSTTKPTKKKTSGVK